MLKLRANKKLVQNHIMEECNSKVTLKDLHNLAYTESGADPLKNIVELLKRSECSTVEVLKNEDETLLGIFYQDQEMRNTYKAYPEIFFLDAIYKVNDRRMPLYVMLVENGNGESEIVALFLITTETAVVLRKIASIFKSYNPSWPETQIILTDKDMTEREAFQSEFPQAKLLICLFHALRSFRREVTVDKRGITTGQRDMCLEQIQRIAYAEGEERYIELYNQFKDNAPRSVLEYFEQNWHNIRHQWVSGLQQKQGRTCGNRTNNRLESTNQKIMQVVKRHCKLEEMFDDLLKLVTSLRTERDCSAAATQLKKPLNIKITHPAEAEYLRILTPYAFSKLKEKLNLLSKVNILEETEDGILVKASEGILCVKTDQCTCCFFIGMGLPCHHIFKCRTVKNLDLFSPHLIARRWTKVYYLENSRLTDHCIDYNDETCRENVPVTTVPSKPTVLSQHQKFRAASMLTTKLATLAAESCKQFQQRIKLLEKLARLWEDDIEPILIHENTTENVFPVDEEIIPAQLLCDVSINDDSNTSTPLAELNVNTTEPNQQPSNLSSQTISKIQLPAKIPKRGRPKGNNKTVVGLPSRQGKKRPSPFHLKHPQEKDAIMLKWFVSQGDVKKALDGTLLIESAVEQNCNKVSTACLDEAVCVTRLRQYFDKDAWTSVLHLLDVKKRDAIWFCPVCNLPIDDAKSICCNSCLEWFHMNCLNLNSAPKSKNWFCKTC